MESIPDSDSEGLGLGGDDRSITNITLAENGHQPDFRSLDEVSLLFRFRLFRSWWHWLLLLLLPAYGHLVMDEHEVCQCLHVKVMCTGGMVNYSLHR